MSVRKNKELKNRILRHVKHNTYFLHDIFVYPQYKNVIHKTVQEKIKCCICYESSEHIKFINCKKGGIQKFATSCCADKPICITCRDKCRKSCPFCRSHKIYNIKKERYPNKKAPWKERMVKILLKKEKKKKLKSKYMKMYGY